MKPESRLLLVEMVLPPGDAPHFGKILDMTMLVMPGGEERTDAEKAAQSRQGEAADDEGRADRVGRQRGGSGPGLTRGA